MQEKQASMISPSINELTEKGKINRYELVVATAKAARIITDEYVRQREYAEKIAMSKEGRIRTSISQATSRRNTGTKRPSRTPSWGCTTANSGFSPRKKRKKSTRRKKQRKQHVARQEPRNWNA